MGSGGGPGQQSCTARRPKRGQNGAGNNHIVLHSYMGGDWGGGPTWKIRMGQLKPSTEGFEYGGKKAKGKGA